MPARDDQGSEREPSHAQLEALSADTLKAQQALLERPQLSIRTRIIFVFVLLAVLCSGITLAAVALISSFEKKIVFLENVGSYAFEVDEARRNEKNFFLYGTNLPEALASVSLAQRHLQDNAEQIRSVVGEGKYSQMEQGLLRYRSYLEQLLPMGAGEAGGARPSQQEIEAQLRVEGAQLLDDAQEMIAQERLAVSSMLRSSMLAAVGFLGFMLLMMFLFGGYVLRTTLRPLNRFMDYVGRIGAGNYEPIRPVRRYRDEFSRLALAFNQMLSEVLSRQEQLVRSGKMASVGTLTSGIAHELNNPLNNIGLTTEALIEDFESYSPDQKRRMLEQIYTQVERASATVRNLLDFTRKGAGAFTALSISEAAHSAIRLASNEARLSGVAWDLDLDKELPQVRGNPNELQQVFLNLFLNAIQAMSDGGEIRVVAGLDPSGQVRVEVSDTGSGIAPEHLDQIFDPFFTTKEHGQGTGLGLAVSHSIIEKHGGAISVTSEVGVGTTFAILLPAAEEA